MNLELCARPACPGKASAWLAYDYDARCAWLDDLPADELDSASRWPLCDQHADSLKVPRGWFSVDRRGDCGGPAPPGEAGGPAGPRERGQRRPNGAGARRGANGAPANRAPANRAPANPDGASGAPGAVRAAAPGEGAQGTLTAIL